MAKQEVARGILRKDSAGNTVIDVLAIERGACDLALKAVTRLVEREAVRASQFDRLLHLADSLGVRPLVLRAIELEAEREVEKLRGIATALELIADVERGA